MSMTMDKNLDSSDLDGIRSVVLRRSEGGLGFSILGGIDLPAVIYGIEKDSPASRCGVLEAGDIILAINEREVKRGLSTKEVLKCLRLSGDIVHIKYKRDPHVVSRVRHFLSSNPHYMCEGSGATEISSSPNHVHGSSQIREHKGPKALQNLSQSHQQHKVAPPVSPRSKITVDRPKELPNPNHISSFSDDLFINHSHSHQQQPQPQQHCQSPPIKSSFHQNNPFANNIEKNGRKNFETFVMTGDAILNVTRTDANDSYQSPTKTSSKLMPMPHHNIMHTMATDHMMKPPAMYTDNVKSFDKSGKNSASVSIEEDSPPLPPPPPSNNSSKSEKLLEKSDNLPSPPPLLENENSHSNRNNFVGNNENGVVVCNKNSSINNGVVQCSDFNNLNNNNEDTSISSSVMSDSEENLNDDDEEEDGDDQELLIGEGSSDKDKNRIVLKIKAEAKPLHSSKGSSNNGTGSSGDAVVPVIPEKERYPEYLLLGKGSPNISEEDQDPNSTSEPITGESRSKRVQKRGKGHIPTKISEVNESDSDSDRGEEEYDHEQDVEEESSETGVIGKLPNGGSGGESDSSDVEESMRVAPVVKAVDLPSAERLAKRLFGLDGFRVTDVWRQLCKCNDFSRAVATEYLKFFDFRNQPLDVSLRKFLSVCPLRGETSERERVLEHFSIRYVECNAGGLGSGDSVHTLTCALMLLNTDIYSDVKARRHMSCQDFIKNLNGLNDGKDFPREILKQLYLSIKSKPLRDFTEEEEEDSNGEVLPTDPPVATNTNDVKRGYLMRKSTYEAGGKKSPLGKRSWKMFFCRLRSELLLILSNDETTKSSGSMHNTQPIKVHHCFATVATDYHKRPHVFKLILADRSQFLFQSSDSREMNSWIEILNWNAAKFSAPALEPPCSSSRRFERPMLPTSVTRLNAREQLASHQATLTRFEEDMNELTQRINGSSKSHLSHHKREIKERLSFYQFEIRRYRIYVDELEKRATDESDHNEGSEELVELQVLPNPPSVLVEEAEENSLS